MLDHWEGPLDLLLALARAQQVDLRQISIFQLVEQYLAVVERAATLRLEVAADWLVMAAWLAYLKSALLLPRDSKNSPRPRNWRCGSSAASSGSTRCARPDRARPRAPASPRPDRGAAAEPGGGRDAGDHRLSRTRDARRDRGDPRRADRRGTLDVRMQAGWVHPAGRRQTPGRPLTFATTPGFLAHFGLASRRDLPGIDDLKAAGLLDSADAAAMQVEVEKSDEDA